MEVSNARARIELIANATPTSTNVQNDVAIGHPLEVVSFADADVAYSVRAIIAEGSDFVLNVADGTTTGSDAWVAGTAQVETATAAGTITATGNATVTVTAAGMTGSPKAISVAVLSGDTAAVWAGKVRDALAADVDVSAVFSVSGASTAIVLTVKEIGGLSIPIYPANDSTINVALDNGTCTGITTAATSANTTAGVATSGCTIYDGDGKDFEGTTIATISTLDAALLSCSSGVVTYVDSGEDVKGTLASGKVSTLIGDSNFLSQITFTASIPSDIKITVIGKTA
jgi:phage tail sheath gpL-like